MRMPVVFLFMYKRSIPYLFISHMFISSIKREIKSPHSSIMIRPSSRGAIPCVHAGVYSNSPSP